MIDQKPKLSSPVGLTYEQMKVWIKDAVRGIIPTGGHCTNGCIYCFLQGNKKRLDINSSINFISREDLRFGLDLLRHKEEDGVIDPMYEIDIGSGGQVIQSEPMLHPFYADLVKIGHEYFPKIPISTVTLGRWADPKDFDTFRECNWKTYITLNTLDQEKRRYMMKGPDDLAGVKHLLAQDDLLNGFFMVFHGDMDIFKRDVEMIENINPGIFARRDARIWPTGYTDTTGGNPDVVDMSKRGMENFKEMLNWCKDNDVRINPVFWELEDSLNMQPTGLKYSDHEHLKEDFENRIYASIEDLEDKGIDVDEVGFLLADSVYKYSEKFDKFINRIRVKNVLFGGTITAAALLTSKDLYNAIENHPVKYKYYVINRDIFRLYHEDVMMKKFETYHTKDFTFILG